MDTIGNMLTIIRNGLAVKKETVSVPFSKFKFRIAEILSKEGIVGEVSKKGRKVKKTISITLKYDENNEPMVRSIKRISKLSRRIYRPLKKIHPIQKGYGIQLLTTSKGVLTDKEAFKEKVGGEVICEIW
jgi:small subunit ribosomal protein S8